MYVAVYDRNYNHITNIQNVKYDITERVFDLDSSTIEGVPSVYLSNEAFIFVLCEGNGKQVYSGFIKSIKYNGKLAIIKGEDFKKILDTELVLDYATVLGQSPKLLGDVFRDVFFALENDIQNHLPIEFEYPNPDNFIDWIANYDCEFLIVNAKNFIKPYLAYYNYYIDTAFNTTSKKIEVRVLQSSSDVSIKLNDFVHESTRSESTINKAIAHMKYDNVEKDNKMWIYSTVEYWNSALNKSDILQMFPEPLEDANLYEHGYALKILYQENGVPEGAIEIYFQVSNAATPRPADLPSRVYYLGNDNQIYESSIPSDKLILPIQSKIFEDAFFQKAQFNAINELVNSRYNENIVITNLNCPIDLKALKLYTKLSVYDKNGNRLVLPIAEIHHNNELYSIKLGFKKMLFTEIIKDKSSADAIKSTNTGGGTTIIEDNGTIYSEVQPTGTPDGSFWIRPIEIIN